VYYMVYADSVTHYSYQKQLERENRAWERLIDAKRGMTNNRLSEAATDAERVLAKDVDAARTDGSTRQGRGKRKAGVLDTPEGRTIAVDVREFRSGLPSALDNGGLRLAPLTLTVGDYVLSKNVVVERKAPGDLRSSLNSGRLFTQMESMEQYERASEVAYHGIEREEGFFCGSVPWD
jgi:DNA excision repair protein ERCC-4